MAGGPGAAERKPRGGRPPRGSDPYYRVGGDAGMFFGASVLPGEGLLPGELPSVLPLSDGEVGGEAAGVRSLPGFSPTRPLWPESVQPAARPVTNASAKSPERNFLIL